MIKDPIVEEIRQYRQAYSEQYNHDLDKLCILLREKQRHSGKKIISRGPRLLNH